MEKNQEFTVVIEDMSEDGAGVGKLDGYIWFIKDTVIGDVVRAKDEKIIWFCTPDGGAGTVRQPGGGGLPRGTPVRRVPASVHEL